MPGISKEKAMVKVTGNNVTVQIAEGRFTPPYLCTHEMDFLFEKEDITTTIEKGILTVNIKK